MSDEKKKRPTRLTLDEFLKFVEEQQDKNWEEESLFEEEHPEEVVKED